MMANIAIISSFFIVCIGVMAAASDNDTAGKLNKWKFQQYRDYKILSYHFNAVCFIQNVFTNVTYITAMIIYVHFYQCHVPLKLEWDRTQSYEMTKSLRHILEGENTEYAKQG